MRLKIGQYLTKLRRTKQSVPVFLGHPVQQRGQQPESGAQPVYSSPIAIFSTTFSISWNVSISPNDVKSVEGGKGVSDGQKLTKKLLTNS